MYAVVIHVRHVKVATVFLLFYDLSGEDDR